MLVRPNWFIALPVVADWLVLPPPPPATRVFAPEDRHFTIAFLGAVTEAQARAAWEALVWPDPPATVTLGAVVPMGPKRRYSALSALLEEGRDPIERAIAAARGACCTAAGVAVDPRPAVAHLTVARPQRKATDDERAMALAWASSIALPRTPLRLASAALYTWSADREQALFRIVERAALPIRASA